MAKKQGDETAVAVMDEPKTTALVAPTDNRGMDGVEGLDDTAMPRLAVAQKTSPQLDPSKSDKYIDGLKLFQMFNSLTKHNYGNGPVKFQVIRTSKRAMQFDAQNNVVDFNVALDDPRCQFQTGPNGERVKPVATVFRDYLLWLPDTREVMILSMKGTQHKVARDLNTLLMIGPKPIWATTYELRSASKQTGAYTTATFSVTPAGKATPEDIAAAENWYDSTANFAERVDRRESSEAPSGDPSDIPF